MKLYQQTLEPIYNRLFEWIQQQNENNEELVWGLGHAKMLTQNGHLINGPLLEVLVEVELSLDGGLLVRPRQHTGVALNREVLAALIASESSTQHAVLTQLHRTVGELESSQLSPGQPTTYVPLLRRIAMEISSGGLFQASSVRASFSPTTEKKKDLSVSASNLIVTEAWCLYSRSKPSSAWARDANTLAEYIALPERFSDALPMATWSLTHGPSKLESFLERRRHVKESSHGTCAITPRLVGSITGWLNSNFISQNPVVEEPETANNEKGEQSIIFPLATSDSQHRIADLLLRQNYPAVIAEGPPGTGKTHSIANIVSAYLCQGKRVLVTSKNANALNVLRDRLPKSIQELCVDVTMSELQGMHQLQQTVERLAIRVSATSSDVESKKCRLLHRSIKELEAQLTDLDERLTTQSESLRYRLHQPTGVKLMEQSSYLIRTAPWLMKTLPLLNIDALELLSNGLKALNLDKNNAILNVGGFQSPPPKALVSLALAKSGSSLSSLMNATRNVVASLPIVGAMMDGQMHQLTEKLSNIRIDNRLPQTDGDWKTVADALNYSLAVHSFQEKSWMPMVKGQGWPETFFDDQATTLDMTGLLEKAVEVKRLQIALDAETEIETISKLREMDAYRARLSTQIQHHSEELADAAVVAELSRSISPDAQSALIRFSQIAGAAKFSKCAKPSKLTQRQRRRRQEYLDAFDRCVRQIPCWIMTSSQISQYLPAEALFDLVVIDESSQSDVTVLPGIMRGKQWLIVGDGKQVSPTEAFVCDDDIDNLKAALPAYCPFADALLPGRSFFDMCARAFPRGRVVLSEHFRCAPEIIKFSNAQFYDGRLIPLRLPTRGERLAPSLIDVKLHNGVKIGKVNEQEADRIVLMARETMELADFGNSRPRTIGIISLLGDDQSRLIRGRLLDAVGPGKMARHEVLIGDPPTFQGAERDIIFLSMVCSPGCAPTQNQQFHFQRVNVAMSRARDRCVLVRSLDLKDIPSLDDAKIPIIEFFMQANLSFDNDTRRSESIGRPKPYNKRYGALLLKFLLHERGYQVADMGKVWKDALCVEHKVSDARVGVMVDCEEASPHEWTSGFAQQKAIERVGWKCLRVDALSLVVNFSSVMHDVVNFLALVGIPDPELDRKHSTEVCHGNVPAKNKIDFNEKNEGESDVNPKIIEVDDDGEIFGIDREDDRKPAPLILSTARPDDTRSSLDFDRDGSIEASKFGKVVDLNFLLQRKTSDENKDDDDVDMDLDDESVESRKVQNRVTGRNTQRTSPKRNSTVRTMKAHRLFAYAHNGHLSMSKKTESKTEDVSRLHLDKNNSIEGEERGASRKRMENNSATSSSTRKRRRFERYVCDDPGSVSKVVEDHDGESYEIDSILSKENTDGRNDDESWREEGDPADTSEGDEGSDYEDDVEAVEAGEEHRH
jgi:hypothetical protein